MVYNKYMKQNYDRLMQEQMKNIPKGTPLLLHSCCAPCSSACLERLKEVFSITVLYYNPNIDDEAEYLKRKEEQIRFLRETGWADFLDCDHEAEKFAQMAKGMENEPERDVTVVMPFGFPKRRKLPRKRGLRILPRL